jgi:glutamine synthetase
LQYQLVDRFLALPQEGKVAAEYVWIGGSGHDLRSKTKVLDKLPSKPEDLPIWNFDGSSTGQAPGECAHIAEFLANLVSLHRRCVR